MERSQTNKRRILRNEIKLFGILKRSLQKQKKYLLDNLQEIYSKPVKILMAYEYLNRIQTDIYKEIPIDVTDEPMGGFWRAMGVYDMIDGCYPQLERVTNVAQKLSYRKFQGKLRENGVLFFEQGKNYINKFGMLNLSNYRGSISRTTKIGVLDILIDGINTNKPINEIADSIEQISEQLFGQNRARLIAITEVSRAYEYGNRYPMNEANKVGLKVTKHWLSVGDIKVRPTHMDNDNEGRVPFEHIYGATGTDISPEGVNCRCTMQYMID